MNFKNGKPVVRYNQPLYIVLNDNADVIALDHPFLGNQRVYTSRVLEIFTTGGGIQAFETRNTNYVLDTYVIPE